MHYTDREIRGALRAVKEAAWDYWETAYDESPSPDTDPAVTLIASRLDRHGYDYTNRTVGEWLRGKHLPRNPKTREVIVKLAEKMRSSRPYPTNTKGGCEGEKIGVAKASRRSY